MIDFSCEKCGPFEQYRSVHSVELPPCPTCAGPTERHWVLSSGRSSVDPVVVYLAPDGTYRFPGTGDGVSAKHYDTLGYTRVEARGWADVRRLESSMNSVERSKIARRVERQQRAMEAGEKIRRSDFFNGIRNGFRVPVDRGDGTREIRTVHLGARARDIAEHLMRNGNNRRVREYDPGVRVDAYSETRSNREPGRGSDGRRLRD